MAVQQWCYCCFPSLPAVCQPSIQNMYLCIRNNINPIFTITWPLLYLKQQWRAHFTRMWAWDHTHDLCIVILPSYKLSFAGECQWRRSVLLFFLLNVKNMNSLPLKRIQLLQVILNISEIQCIKLIATFCKTVDTNNAELTSTEASFTVTSMYIIELRGTSINRLVKVNNRLRFFNSS